MAKKINLKFKRLITGLLVFLVRFLELFFKVFSIIIIFIAKLLAPFFIFIFKKTYLPIYGWYLVIKSRTAKRTNNFLERILLAVANKYTVYFVILIISAGVVAGNINPSSNRDQYGQNALVYKLIGVENTEVVEDTFKTTDESKIYSYMGENSQVETDLFTESQRQAEELFDEQSRVAMNEEGSSLSKPDLVDTEQAKTGSKDIKTYVVAEGDTISRIAAKFNISINTILWANNLAATSYIKEGQKLTIPPVSGVLHMVVRGDTVSKIAQKYDTSAETIMAYNNIDEKGLVIGKTVMVPGGRIIYTARPRTSVATAPRSGTQTYDADDSSIVSSGSMVWPNGCRRISQYFRGWIHTGVDIACPSGTPERASDDGVVTRVQYGSTGYGYNVIINHGGGIQTLYGHMSRIDVKVGQTVSKGQQIGLEGSTGRSTGPHLHFEVRVNGTQVNPLNYIR